MRRATRQTRPVLPPLPPLDPALDLADERAPPLLQPEAEGSAGRRLPVSEAMIATARTATHALDLRPTAMWERTAEIAAVMTRADSRARELMAGSAYPFAAYDRFRRDHAVRPPPGRMPGADGLVVIVDAAAAAPFLVRETLRSLQEQSVADWQAVIVAPAATRAHPVGSFGEIDPRIRFVDPADFTPAGGSFLLVSAGTALDPQALAWLVFAAARTGAEAVFADHDHGVHDPDLGALRSDPWFFAALDRASLDWLPAPAAVWVSAALAARSAPVLDGSEAWRRAALGAATGVVAHVPRVIATIMELPLKARGGRDTPQDGKAGRLGPVAPLLRASEIPAREGRIAIVIPTRDGADLLDRAVDSLRQTARQPDRLDIVVVDNNSVEPETLALLDRLEVDGAARRLWFAKPFNWGLANNEGAAASDAEFLVFANNDIEMLSRNWDDAVIEALTSDGVGVVGARLLYPNATVQHGGVVFGMVAGHTEHEGRGIAAADPGPNWRLVTPRTVAAVTGAFLGMTRALWAELGGIDVVMGVAHSDFDLCLRVRERGLTVRYEPRIEAIHFESVTRGFNSTKADVAWDESERGDLVGRWGSSMVEDVGVSPYWAPSPNPFDLIREPSMVEIVRHIDRTGRALPWRPSRAEEQGDAAWRAEALG